MKGGNDKVEDYEKWKPVFDEDALNREASGSKGGYVFRNADDCNELRCRKETAQRQIGDPKFYVLVSKTAKGMLKRNGRHGCRQEVHLLGLSGAMIRLR